MRNLRRSPHLTMLTFAAATAFLWPAAAFSSLDVDGAIAAGSRDFNLDCYRALVEDDANLFVSPLSIATALLMAQAGAAGATAEQMADVLRVPDDPAAYAAYGDLLTSVVDGSDGAVSVANAAWLQDGFPVLPTYLDRVRDDLDSEHYTADFAGDNAGAVDAINGWVDERTEGMIPELVDVSVIGPMTRLVLTNAIHFLGTWESAFEAVRTRDEPFTTAAGGTRTVPLMHRVDRYGYAEAEVDGRPFQILELPYAEGDLAMVVLLPGKADGLPSLEAGLTGERLDEWLGSLRSRQVDVALPRFELRNRPDVVPTLRAMGMLDAFEPGRADFSGISAEPLAISDVIHEAVVRVDEEGTEAAAATAVVMKTSSVSPSRPPVFRADRPFAFLIRDRASGTILFMGRLADPGA